MPDYYLANPAALKGQPKRTIGDYVEQNGILVPRRFASLDEARRSGLSIIARSEHPLEYLISDLCESPSLTHEYKNVHSEYEFKQMVLEGRGKNINHIGKFSELMGIPKEDFLRGLSFSFWEKIGGHNLLVIGDSAIKNRYHIFSDNYGYSYVCVDNGVLQITGLVPDEVLKGIEGIVGMYNTTANLKNFDNGHKPLMELQHNDGKNFFLQYHRGREFVNSDFKLQRHPDKYEVKAVFVRGSTPPEGLVVDTTFAYAAKFDDNWKLGQEDGSIELYHPPVFSELMVRKRILQVVVYNSIDRLVAKTMSEHLGISLLFKPEISVAVSQKQMRALVSQEESDQLLLAARQSQINQRVQLYVISDGRTAYVSRYKHQIK